MGELLGVGMTHFPPLAWPDPMMDRRCSSALADPAVPDAVKPGEGWPDGMRAEFDRDRSEAAAEHRAALVDGCDRVRAALDEFAPDVRRDLGRRPVRAVPRGRRAAVLHRRQPGRDDVPAVDVADGCADPERLGRGRPARPTTCAATPRSAASSPLRCSTTTSTWPTPTNRAPTGPFPHAIANTVMFLDYHRRGFPYAVVPFTVNCYGRLAIGRRGGDGRASPPARTCRC